MNSVAFLRPFSYKDFRLIFYSEILFYIAAWMAVMVFGLLATHLKGNSPFYVGLIGFSFNLPMLLGPFIGVIVDQTSRPAILKITTLIALLAAITMGLLLENSAPNYWILLLNVIVYGLCCAFYYPAILTCTHDVIKDNKVLGNGISIINSTNRIMMFFGYGLGGILLTYFSERASFWVNAILFFISLLFLLKITTKVTLPEKYKSAWVELKSGFSFIKTSPPIFSILILLGLMGLLAWPYLFEAPIVNRYYLHGTPSTLGFLLAIGGLGGTVGAFIISARKSSLGLNRIFVASIFTLSASMILLSLCRSVFWATPIIFILDFCLMVTLTIGIIFIQQILPKEYLGRVMGIISMVSFGSIPIGSVIFYGTIGEFLGVMSAFIVAAIILILGAIWYLNQLSSIRQYAAPILIQQGLLENKDEAYKI